MMKSTKIHIFESKDQARSFVNKQKYEGKVVGFVPTMGCLHKGHLSLIEASKEQTDITIVSIYVNPTQFAPNEDFDSYPRTFNDDIEKCERLGVDAIFAPSDKVMYPGCKQDLFTVHPPVHYIDKMCGASRMGHFEGVATVVVKL